MGILIFGKSQDDLCMALHLQRYLQIHNVHTCMHTGNPVTIYFYVPGITIELMPVGVAAMTKKAKMLG